MRGRYNTSTGFERRARQITSRAKKKRGKLSNEGPISEFLFVLMRP